MAIRNREQLATLRVRDGVIVLETMIWPDEVREAAFPFLDEDVDLRPQEREMAESLVASMAGDFDPDAYSDDYREALQQVIDAKIEGREVVEAPQAEPTAGNVVDLMSACAPRSRPRSAVAARPRQPRRRRSPRRPRGGQSLDQDRAREEGAGQEGAGKQDCGQEGTSQEGRGQGHREIRNRSAQGDGEAPLRLAPEPAPKGRHEPTGSRDKSHNDPVSAKSCSDFAE